MAYEFQIDLEAGIIRETWTGTVDFASLVASCHEEWNHQHYHKGLMILSDFRQARAKLTADEVLQFASWFCNDDAPPKNAIVVRRQRGVDFAEIFTMIRNFNGSVAERTRLFFSYTEADLWLRSRDNSADPITRPLPPMPPKSATGR